MSALQNTIDEDLDLGLNRARIPEPQLGVQIRVVVPWERVAVGQLVGRQSHHLRVACPGRSAIWGIGHSLRGNDGNSIRAYHLHRSPIYPSITCLDAVFRRNVIATHIAPSDINLDSSRNRIMFKFKGTNITMCPFRASYPKQIYSWTNHIVARVDGRRTRE